MSSTSRIRSFSFSPRPRSKRGKDSFERIENECRSPPRNSQHLRTPSYSRKQIRKNGKYLESSYSGRSLQLELEETKLIQKRWLALISTAESKIQLGKSMFQHIFNTNPTLTPLFGFQGSGDDYIRLQYPIELVTKLAAHIDLFIGALNNMICGICDVEGYGRNVVQLIRDIGQTHANIPGVSFDAKNWLLFKFSIMDIIKRKGASNRELGAWSAILMFIIHEMKHAFLSTVTLKYSTGSMKKVSFQHTVGEPDCSKVAHTRPVGDEDIQL